MRRASLFALAAASGALALAAAVAGASDGKTVRVEVAAARQVYVPAGSFSMGISEDLRAKLLGECREHFEPVPARSSGGTELCELYDKELSSMEPRDVFVSAFWMDRDEVSVANYRACVAGGGCEVDPLVTGDDRYRVTAWPIVNVTWAEAQVYCAWRGGRLPTEAEWERAARGDGASEWPWGDTLRPADFNHGQPRSAVERQLDRSGLQDVEVYVGSSDASDGAETLAPPGSFRWSDGPYGTRDQAGNAAEWTEDVFVHTNDAAGYDGLGRINPLRAGGIGDPHVVRGGSWRQPEGVARTNVRDPFQILLRAERRYSYVGFRCVRPA